MQKKINRFERKWIFKSNNYLVLINSLIRSNLFFKKHHPKRRVNSIYFDTSNYASIRENLDGVSNKKKIRLRWYGNTDRITNPILEIKSKKGFETKKENIKISELDNLIFRSLKNLEIIQNKINERIKTKKTIYPILTTNYDREYYISYNDKIRATVDYNLKSRFLKNLTQMDIIKNFTKVCILEARLRWPVDYSLTQTLKGQKFVNLSRRGKYILFHLTNGTLIGHLGMSGSFRIDHHSLPLKKHDHVSITLGNGKQLRYHDPRRFGSLHWMHTNPLSHRLLKNLGPEPLSDAFTPCFLYQALQKSKKPVKACLMDHHLVVGVGNIYATEALFKSFVHPNRPANLVSLKEATVICQHIQSLLKHAISLGGTTLKDFVNADSKPGYFQQTLQAYGRDKKPCLICKNPLDSVLISQRKSVFCQVCQI